MAKPLQTQLKMNNQLILILGPPSRDGEVMGMALSQHLNVPFIHFAHAIRQELTNKSDLGIRMKLKIDGGEFIPDQMLLEFAFSKYPPKNFDGLIVIGYPRTISQIENFKAEYNGAISSILGVHLEYKTISDQSLCHEQREKKDDYDSRNKEILDYLQEEESLIIVDADYELSEIIKKIEATNNS